MPRSAVKRRTTTAKKETIRAIVPGRMSMIVEAMDWVEEEIDKAKAMPKHKRHQQRIDKVFRLAFPTMTLTSERLIRAHTKELIDRVVKRTDTREATWAEIVGVCYRLSLAAPLAYPFGAIYAEAFHRCFGELPPGCETPSKDDRNSPLFAETLQELRDSLRQPERTLETSHAR